MVPSSVPRFYSSLPILAGFSVKVDYMGEENFIIKVCKSEEKYI